MVRLYFPAASFVEELWAINTIRNDVRNARTPFDLISFAPAKRMEYRLIYLCAKNGKREL